MVLMSASLWAPTTCAVAAVLAVMTPQPGSADDPEPMTETSHTAGGGGPAPRIFNGTSAAQGLFPYMAHVAINKNGTKLRCGGMLIHRSWVLTAGHCMKGLGKNIHLKVSLGIADLLENDEDRQDFEVDRMVPHPGFKPGQVNTNFSNDIGLLHLSHAANLTNNVDVLSMVGRTENVSRVGLDGLVMGWGLEKVDWPPGTDYSRSLSYIYAKIVEPSRCWKFFNTVPDNKTLCMEGLNNGSARLGDNGGPFIVKNQLVGVLTRVLHTAADSTLSILTRVGPYRPWINSYLYPGGRGTRRPNT